ncbi:MAG: hypothetical protein ACI4Q6_03680 [Huintestinicola sp.]
MVTGMEDKRTEKERRAAKAALRKAYKKKMRRNRSKASIIGIPVALVLIIACLVSIVSDKVELAEKQQELAVLREHAKELEIENAGYASILSEEDERTYMERIATEKLGYAYPEERRFYDTTRS